MWLTVNYEPVAAFGLRPSNTTSSGGKSLLVPTPYTVKMALLDVAIRHGGLDYGKSIFPFIRDLTIYLHAPQAAAVNRTFQRILRPGGKNEVWKQTIVQREYVIHSGLLTLTLNPATEIAQDIDVLMSIINYFGRRGSFIQWVNSLASTDQPAIVQQSVNLCEPMTQIQMGFMQRMDDMRDDATFNDVSTYNKKKNRDDGGRKPAYYIVLPYQLVYNGFNHSIYERRGD